MIYDGVTGQVTLTIWEKKAPLRATRSPFDALALTLAFPVHASLDQRKRERYSLPRQGRPLFRTCMA